MRVQRILIPLFFFLKVCSVTVQNVHVADLHPGDVLLFRGNAVISRLIQFFDGSPYSHTGIYTGDGVLEAVAEGVKKRPLEESIKGVEYVDVYRYSTTDGHTLGDSVYPLAPIEARMKYYEANGDRYAYEELFLLSILASTRHLPLPVVMPLVRVYLDRAVATMPIFLSGGKEPMTCSELIYRCYAESDTTGKYRLQVLGTEPENLEGQIYSGVRDASMPAIDSTIDDQLSKQDQKEMKEFIALYAKAKNRSDAKTKWTTSDFVTPHDLMQSPNLKKIGRLKK
jgi:hypothetical protein